MMLNQQQTILPGDFPDCHEHVFTQPSITMNYQPLLPNTTDEPSSEPPPLYMPPERPNNFLEDAVCFATAVGVCGVIYGSMIAVTAIIHVAGGCLALVSPKEKKP